MDRAARFHEALTGHFLKRETDVRGALFKNPAMQPAAQGTLVYLNAGQTLEPWLARVAAAGGRVVLPKVTLPDGMGCFAHIIDSEGNRVGLHALA